MRTTKGRGASDDRVERYFADQPSDKRALLEELRALVEKAVPGAEPSIKWGVPVYQLNGKNVFALAGFKDHVAINFFAPPEVFDDPRGRLEGGKTNRALKVRSAKDIDRSSITRWLKATASRAER